MNKRNKRLMDVLLSLFLLITFPLNVFIVNEKRNYLGNIFSVLRGEKSWVGYASQANDSLPPLKPAVLSPLDGLAIKVKEKETIQRLNLIYAKEYNPSKDLEIIWKGFRSLGN